QLRPVTPPETLRALLRPRYVGHIDKSVVHLREGDLLSLELACQPFVAIDIDLHRERAPRLDLDMHEAKVAIHQIEVQHQAAPQVRFHYGMPRAVTDPEGAACFHRRIDTHQAVFDLLL